MLGEHCYVTSLMTDLSLKGTCAVSGKLSSKVVFCQKIGETKCVAQMVEIYSMNSRVANNGQQVAGHDDRPNIR